MRKFDYHQPKTVAEALQLMQEAKGMQKYVAGGTDLIVRMKQGLVHPLALISLRGIESLKFIRTDSDGGMTLGSMTPLRDIERDERIRESYPALWQAVRVLANPQVRNVATIGGNVVNSAPLEIARRRCWFWVQSSCWKVQPVGGRCRSIASSRAPGPTA